MGVGLAAMTVGLGAIAQLQRPVQGVVLGNTDLDAVLCHSSPHPQAKFPAYGPLFCRCRLNPDGNGQAAVGNAVDTQYCGSATILSCQAGLS